MPVPELHELRDQPARPLADALVGDGGVGMCRLHQFQLRLKDGESLLNDALGGGCEFGCYRSGSGSRGWVPPNSIGTVCRN